MGKGVYQTESPLQALLMALIGISTEDAGQCTLRCKVTPFAPAPGILLCDCGCIAQTHGLGSPCCKPILTHIPLGMQGAPAQLAAGCQLWIFLVNILGVVVAPGPKQPMVCSCQDQCWAPHSVPAEISMICFSHMNAMMSNPWLGFARQRLSRCPVLC